MSGEILPTCTHCHAPAREERISKLYGYDITLCPACDRRFDALVDWDNEQLLRIRQLALIAVTRTMTVGNMRKGIRWPNAQAAAGSSS